MNIKKYPVDKSDEEWREILSEKEFKILIKKGTDLPFSGKYDKHFEKGDYYCRGCNNKLFSSINKFDSACGWPSFDDEVDSAQIDQIADNTLGMRRIEIVCSNCGGHLGHIFNDGPTKTGLRYCVNSTSLTFKASD